jgi:hypothetical protein
VNTRRPAGVTRREQMPRQKGARRAERERPEGLKVVTSPKTPTQTVGEGRLSVSFSPRDRVHQFSVLQGDLDERREHWHQILDAAALYNSDEDDAFDESDEESVEPPAPTPAAAAAVPEPPASATVCPEAAGSQRRSSVAAGLDDSDAPRCLATPGRMTACLHFTAMLQPQRAAAGLAFLGPQKGSWPPQLLTCHMSRVDAGQKDGAETRHLCHWQQTLLLQHCHPFPCKFRVLQSTYISHLRCQPQMSTVPAFSDPRWWRARLRRIGAIGAVVGRLPTESQRLLAQYIGAATGSAGAGSSGLGLAAC